MSDMGVTSNAVLLLGFIGGTIEGPPQDGGRLVYEVVSTDAGSGSQIVRNPATGNLYRVSVVQLEGTE